MENHSARVSNEGQYFSKPVVNSVSGSGTVTINWDEGAVYILTLTGSPTIAFSNGQPGARYLLKIKTGAGSFSVTWPTINWIRAGGVVPTVPTESSKIAMIGLFFDGADYDGSYADNA